jgi:hypothetical protein
VLPESNKQYPLSIQRVKEIKRLNFRGEKAQELQPVELITNKPAEMEHSFVDVVGQISLKTLEKDNRRRHEQRRNGGDNKKQQRQQHNSQQREDGQKTQQQQRPPQNNQQQRPPKHRPTFNKPPQNPGDKK